MARSTLAAIIAAVRTNIGDPAGASQVFSDDDIQLALDNRRRDLYMVQMTPAPTIAVGGVMNFLDYYADGGWWEDTVVVQDNTFKPLTAITSPVALAATDLVTGRWTLSFNLNPPVWMTGKQFDLNGASADLLEAWVAKLKLEFDFLSTGRTFKRRQQVLALNELIERYRKRQWLGYSEMVRTDMNGDGTTYVHPFSYS